MEEIRQLNLEGHDSLIKLVGGQTNEGTVNRKFDKQEIQKSSLMDNARGSKGHSVAERNSEESRNHPVISHPMSTNRSDDNDANHLTPKIQRVTTDDPKNNSMSSLDDESSAKKRSILQKR